MDLLLFSEELVVMFLSKLVAPFAIGWAVLCMTGPSTDTC